MLHYILQVVAFQLGFLIVYDVFLRKETFFNWNRAYLLITAVLSILIPFIKLESIKTMMPEEFIIRLPEVIVGSVTKNSPINLELDNLSGISVDPEPISIWNILLFSGMCIALIILIFKISKLVLLASMHPKRWSDNLLIIKLLNSSAAFSFFHYVFLGENIRFEDRSSILKHEMIHVKQKHTLDLLFFEALRIVFWFNPLIYIYQNRIATLHEYIADNKAVKHQTKTEYYNNLLAQVFETQQFSFVNPFFKQSLIKKRIIMLSKTKSNQVNILKYTLLIPMVCAMLVYTSTYAQEKLEVIVEEVSENNFQDNPISQDAEETLLTEKITAIKKQIEIKGNVIPEEEKGLELLLKLVESSALDMNLVNNIQDYMNLPKQTSLMNSINAVFEQIQLQGHLSDFEEKSLKRLLVLTTKNGFNNHALEEVVESVEVPFAIVDQVPVMLTCQGLATNEEQKGCMSKNIAIHVNKNFNVDLAKQLGLVGKQRIHVIFKIDAKGDVIDVRARAPHPKLESEAKRVIKLLPQFKPGMQKGKAVVVPYSLPILFQINDDVHANKPATEAIKEISEKAKQKVSNLSEIPFSIVEQAPIFSSCTDKNQEEDRKKCTSNAVSVFVSKNFNIDLASKIGLVGKQRISVIFKIDTMGNVIDVRARAPHPELEKEAKRVVKLLPQFIPGKHKGKTVSVPYSLPIVFYVNPDKKN